MTIIHKTKQKHIDEARKLFFLTDQQAAELKSAGKFGILEAGSLIMLLDGMSQAELRSLNKELCDFYNEHREEVTWQWITLIKDLLLNREQT